MTLNALIPFTSIKTIKKGGRNVPEDFTCKDNENTTHTITCEVKNECKFTVINKGIPDPRSFNSFWVHQNVLLGDNLHININHRNKGIGTILHLAKVIEMMENNYSAIKINSLNTAVLFHAKFGFRPDIQSRKEASFILSSIIPLCNYNEELTDLGKKSISLLSKNNIANDKFINNANKIFSDFLDICTTSKTINPKNITLKEDIFYENLLYNLKLTREDIINNREFYNELYDKYNIDYEI